MKKLPTVLLTLLLATAFVLRGAAQTTDQITGQLWNEKNQPLPFATVVLRQVVDTTWVRLEVAQADGHYYFANLAPASYRVMVIMLGYQSYRSPPLELKALPGTVQVPLIQLERLATSLKA